MSISEEVHGSDDGATHLLGHWINRLLRHAPYLAAKTYLLVGISSSMAAMYDKWIGHLRRETGEQLWFDTPCFRGLKALADRPVRPTLALVHDGLK